MARTDDGSLDLGNLALNKRQIPNSSSIVSQHYRDKQLGRGGEEPERASKIEAIAKLPEIVSGLTRRINELESIVARLQPESNPLPQELSAADLANIWYRCEGWPEDREEAFNRKLADLGFFPPEPER